MYFLNLLFNNPSEVDPVVFASIVDAVHQQGYIVCDDVFPVELLQRLFVDIKQSDREEFHAAGVGREQEHQLNPFIRRDRIRWLTPDHPPVLDYLNWMERLRLRINRDLFLGLFDYECHYAHYPQGAFYKKHVDAFRGSSNRRLTTILYLNPAWQPGHGGELVMYSPDGETPLQVIEPSFGRLVIFLSEEFPHEVRLSHCSRFSLTGWFRIYGSHALSSDPPR